MTITIQTSNGPRETETRWLGQFLAVHNPNGEEPKRGLWSISHHRSGLRAACVATNLRAAVKLAKAWDLRFATLDPKDANAWPEREAWAQAIRETETPAIANRFLKAATRRFLDDEFGTSLETAAVLAAQAGRPIDQHNGSKRMQWRRQYWPLPTDAELQQWTCDSVCETPDGRSVEPDHPDSWLRLLGFV